MAKGFVACCFDIVAGVDGALRGQIFQTQVREFQEKKQLHEPAVNERVPSQNEKGGLPPNSLSGLQEQLLLIP